MTIRIHITCCGEDHDVTVDKDGNAHVDPKHHDVDLEMSLAEMGSVATPCVACATDPDKHCFGSAASYQEDLSPEDRMLLADFVDDEWRGNIANYAPNLTVDQRLELLDDGPPDAIGNFAVYGEGLESWQRVDLIAASTLPYMRELRSMSEELGLTYDDKLLLSDIIEDAMRGR